jgi:cobalt/nickel transport system permease protein
MHIPDGFIDPKTSTGLGFAAATVLGFALSKVHQLVTHSLFAPALATVGKSLKNINGRAHSVMSSVGQEYLSKMGMMASLVFSAQMFNFPIVSGTSGHLVGGVLAAAFLGPWGGAVAISCVLLVQALFYADGGLAVLGANIVNMAVLGCIVSYYAYALLKKLKLNSLVSLGIAAWFSVILAATACALELAVSGTFTLSATLVAMVKVHSIIGLCEGLITVALVLLIQRLMKWELQ